MQSILSEYRDLFLCEWANIFSVRIANAFEYPNQVACNDIDYLA